MPDSGWFDANSGLVHNHFLLNMCVPKKLIPPETSGTIKAVLGKSLMDMLTRHSITYIWRFRKERRARKPRNETQVYSAHSSNIGLLPMFAIMLILAMHARCQVPVMLMSTAGRDLSVESTLEALRPKSVKSFAQRPTLRKTIPSLS